MNRQVFFTSTSKYSSNSQRLKLRTVRWKESHHGNRCISFDNSDSVFIKSEVLSSFCHSRFPFNRVSTNEKKMSVRWVFLNRCTGIHQRSVRPFIRQTDFSVQRIDSECSFPTPQRYRFIYFILSSCLCYYCNLRIKIFCS